MDAQIIIDRFGMKPLPQEGGFYVETYRCPETIDAAALPRRYDGDRCFTTAILYLITPDNFSRLHRVKSDEIFHFYLGDPIRMIQITDGRLTEKILGPNLSAGHQLQAVIPHGTWQACRLLTGSRFALMGCTVSPGFEFADYESPDPEQLIAAHPDLQNIIKEFS